MPIYAYRCESCGHAQDVLQKISDPLLTVCPACGQATYRKQVTAAGFQLKGSGWYVTDFRNNGAGAPPATGVPPVKTEGDAAAPATGESKGAVTDGGANASSPAPASGSGSGSGSASSPAASSSAAPTPASSSTPTAGKTAS